MLSPLSVKSVCDIFCVCFIFNMCCFAGDVGEFDSSVVQLGPDPHGYRQTCVSGPL